MSRHHRLLGAKVWFPDLFVSWDLWGSPLLICINVPCVFEDHGDRRLTTGSICFKKLIHGTGLSDTFYIFFLTADLMVSPMARPPLPTPSPRPHKDVPVLSPELLCDLWIHSPGDRQRGKTRGSNPRLPSRDPTPSLTPSQGGD